MPTACRPPNYVGAIADPSNIEALPSTRLFTSWFQQNFYDDKVSLRIGPDRRRRTSS